MKNFPQSLQQVAKGRGETILSTSNSGLHHWDVKCFFKYALYLNRLKHLPQAYFRVEAWVEFICAWRYRLAVNPRPHLEHWKRGGRCRASRWNSSWRRLAKSTPHSVHCLGLWWISMCFHRLAAVTNVLLQRVHERWLPYLCDIACLFRLDFCVKTQLQFSHLKARYDDFPVWRSKCRLKLVFFVVVLHIMHKSIPSESGIDTLFQKSAEIRVLLFPPLLHVVCACSCCSWPVCEAMSRNVSTLASGGVLPLPSRGVTSGNTVAAVDSILEHFGIDAIKAGAAAVKA